MNPKQLSALIEALYQSHCLARNVGDDDVSGACRNAIAELRLIQKQRDSGTEETFRVGPADARRVH